MNVTTAMNVTSAMKVLRTSKLYSLMRYDIVPETLHQPYLGEYNTYGIRITTPEYTDILHDVSVCKETSEHIVRLLNINQVAPVHFYDVVVDMLP